MVLFGNREEIWAGRKKIIFPFAALENVFLKSGMLTQITHDCENIYYDFLFIYNVF